MTPGTDWIDQAQRLVEALRGGLAGAAPAAADSDGDGHSSDCRWCPVCQVAAVVRGERPEVTAALADVLTAAATALRTVAAAGHPDEAAADDAPKPQESAPPPPVQQIDIA
jgi:nucleoid-associated protein YgaU